MMLPRVVMLPNLRPGTCLTSSPPRSVFDWLFTRCAAVGTVRAPSAIIVPHKSLLYDIPKHDDELPGPGIRVVTRVGAGLENASFWVDHDHCHFAQRPGPGDPQFMAFVDEGLLDLFADARFHR